MLSQLKVKLQEEKESTTAKFRIMYIYFESMKST